MPSSRSGRRASSVLLATIAATAAALVASGLTGGPATASSTDRDERIVASTPTTTQTRTPTAATAGQGSGDGRLTLSRSQRAHAALERAERAFSPRTPASERPDASMALRKLWMLRSALPKAERKVADRIGARPVSNQVDCTSSIACIHWNSTTSTAQWAGTVRGVIDYVGHLYQSAGYKATLPDNGAGGSTATDVYIEPLQPGLYGYCKPTGKFKPGTHATAAFCVLDNDYAGFPAHTPLENLEVTAAHEFFHATQFAYDAVEDTWMLEATAVWMEDEVYPDVNDNLQYLADSPLTRPRIPLDSFQQGDTYYYGVWNFFRYLTEKFPTLQGPLPQLMLKIWQAADSTNGARKDRYSLQAINTALRKTEHTSLATQFALYSDATRRTHSDFAEGAALDYPTKKLAGKARLTRKHRQGTFSIRLNHLTSATYRFVSSRQKAGAKLQLKLNMAPRATGSLAVVSTYLRDGGVSTKLVKLNKAGDRTKRFPFASDQVWGVEVTVVNASMQFRKCFQNLTIYSCYGGIPLDQQEKETVTARAVS